MQKRRTLKALPISTPMLMGGGAKSGVYFMQYFSAKKDVSAATDDPKGDISGRKNVDYPLRVSALKSFSKIR